MAKRQKDGENDIVEEARAEESDAGKTGEEAHGATEKKEMKTGEEYKRGGKVKKRERGGGLKAETEHKHGLPSKMKPIAPHHYARKHGGHVPGEKGMDRPDRRARGGATSDVNPTTAAGKMSVPSYEHKDAIAFDGGGKGPDVMKDMRLRG